MVRAAAIAVLLASSAGAHAEWKIEGIQDRMTDKTVNVAYVLAEKPDRDFKAMLVVACFDQNLVSGRYVELRTTASFTPGRMGLRYRIDDGQPVPRYMSATSDGHGMSLFMQPGELTLARRLRIELTPAGAEPLFFEFSVTGADKAIQAVSCRSLRKSGGN